VGADRQVTLPVVLDTNVLVSALLFSQGQASWLRPAWQDGTLRPLVGKATAAELLRVLQYPKFRLTEAEREDLLADILPFCETVTIDDPPYVPSCRDPDDRKFLEFALAGGADALVTGDADLLALAPEFAIPIVTPAQLKERLRAPPR
jgi:putative PIN family toxin of toxin-antitoxin system